MDLDFARVLSQHVSRMNISVRDLECITGLSKSKVSYLMTGKRVPQDDDLRVLAKAFDLRGTDDKAFWLAGFLSRSPPSIQDHYRRHFREDWLQDFDIPK